MCLCVCVRKKLFRELAARTGTADCCLLINHLNTSVVQPGDGNNLCACYCVNGPWNAAASRLLHRSSVNRSIVQPGDRNDCFQGINRIGIADCYFFVDVNRSIVQLNDLQLLLLCEQSRIETTTTQAAIFSSIICSTEGL